jgi:hypothetical protein
VVAGYPVMLGGGDGSGSGDYEKMIVCKFALAALYYIHPIHTLAQS